ncbi:MAG: SDR family oxidoreductase [Candidatus Nanopelagicales bacterium]
MTAIAGAHALVTGGSSGIGLATALELGRRGARVSLVARRPEPLQEAEDLLRRNGIPVATASADVSDREAITAAVRDLEDRQGPCDVLVTSAGMSRPGRFLELADEHLERLMAVNYFGTVWPVRAVVPGMVERRRGSVVGVSSAAGLIGVYGYTAYGASKFAVRGLLEALRGEVAPYGVHVGVVCPPDVDTPMLAEEAQWKPPETAAISGTIAPIPAEQVAVAIARGVQRERFWITCDAQTAAVLRAAGPAWEVLQAVMDRSARKAGPHRA